MRPARMALCVLARGLSEQMISVGSSTLGLSRKSSKCVQCGEPNYFSPNANALLVDTIALSAPAIVLQDIPNSSIHFQTILFSPPGVGEPLWVVQ